MGAAEAAPIRLLFVMLVTRIDLEALAIFGHRDLTLDRRERPESAERAAKLVTAHIVERPHVLGLKAQMRLRDEGLAVKPNESEVLDRVGYIPAMVAVLHSRRPLKRPIAGVGRPSYSAAKPTLCVQRQPSEQ